MKNIKPEIIGDWIHIPVKKCDITATIDIDKKKKIKALYCGKIKQVGTYLFHKSIWTMEEAQEWVDEHKREVMEMDLITKKMKLIDIRPQLAHELAEEMKIDAEEVEYIEKGFVSEVKDASGEERSITALVSTNAIDRDEEVLEPQGWRLKNYRKNPVVLFAHRYNEPPVAKSVWIKRDEKGLLAKMNFAETAFADEIYQMYEGKFMRAFSVGFVPIKYQDYDEEERKAGQPKRRYTEQELLEYSCVPVPANPEAVVQAMEKGLIKTKTLKDAFGIIEKEVTEKIKAEKYKCECIKCGYKLESEKHCKDIKCPKCGGTMRRVERPGPGQRDIKKVATNTPRKKAGITAKEVNDLLDGAIKQKMPEIASEVEKTLRGVISDLTGKVE